MKRLGVVEADFDKKNKVQSRDLGKLHLIGLTLIKCYLGQKMLTKLKQVTALAYLVATVSSQA
ncbi:hypothetical protein C1E24_17325 [Pseudoalteromonas phenolica]|uniref:Uncharacterized protein n=1 Tax=Pseudoalteromonas phenolica TaxID=161398 RepID=A0A5R9PZB0_9GAMM|nr:hypothetical protein C1E24_17325 [Pseudoalteromonas phenolica]